RSQTRLMAEGPALTGANVRQGGSRSVRFGRAVSVVLLLLSGVLLGVFLLDARFRVRTVAVEGATLVDQNLVIAAADLYERPVFLLNGRKTERHVAETFGCFERVRVQARLPDRVTIRVTEKSAMLIWERQGAYWWLDGQGKVLSEAMGHGELPVLHDRSDMPVTVGGTIPGVPWEYIVRMVGALPAVKDFEYTLEDGLIVFVTTERWPVYLGSDGDPAYKVSVLRELTAALTTDGAQVVYIDIKNEQRPAVQFVEG
ncbi:MAG: cell division protein FtsQ/DivIB, partial [Anaerolineae bacterium]